MLDSTGQEQAIGGSEEGSRTSVAAAGAVVSETERAEESKEKESKAEVKKKTRGSRRSQRVANRGLYVSPGLRFITRKDLYTFLTSAGVSTSQSVCCASKTTCLLYDVMCVCVCVQTYTHVKATYYMPLFCHCLCICP